MDLKKETVQARSQLMPIVQELKGLGFLSMSLQNTKMMSNCFVKNYATFEPAISMAFSKAIVVDYGRLWKQTNNKYLTKINMSFLPIGLSAHNELLELRDKLVAHPDHGFETLELGIGGMTINNDPQAPDTHDNVFVALNTRIEVRGSMWWINDLSTIERINSHIEDCLKYTYDRLKLRAEEFVHLCTHHAHVLKELNDLFSLREFIDDGDGKRTQPDIVQNPLGVSEPKTLKVGRTNLVATMGVYESGSFMPVEKITGNGFIIELTKENDFRVTFPVFQDKK